MKINALSAGAIMLVACGGEPGPSVRLNVYAPQDDSCIGVAGFEVTITPAGQHAATRRIVGTAPVLAAEDCRLHEPFSLAGLGLDTPVTVSVIGYDATGTSARVSGRREISSLREGDIRLQLAKAAQSLPTLLVFRRNRFLENVPWDAITSMSITTQMGSKPPLLNVDPRQAHEFFLPEPGAFGIPSGLVPGGEATNTALNVDFTAPGYTVKNGRITVGPWTAEGSYYTAE
jgi:hypothetical protein